MMDKYLQVDVPDDARGVLQDVHWSLGSFGYFPSYAIGAVIALVVWMYLLSLISLLGCEYNAVRERLDAEI